MKLDMKNMINVTELKKIQLDLLKTFACYCEENNLTYYLAYGTLIGAVRHKGYIPWDDDIDVMMPRNDYEKLISCFNIDNIRSDVAVVSHEIDYDYYLPFAKLINTNTVIKEDINIDYELGVYIDVFPIENLGNDKRRAAKIIRRAFCYNELLTIKYIKYRKERAFYKNALIFLGKTALKPISKNMIIYKLNKMGTQTNDTRYTKYVGVTTVLDNALMESASFEEITIADFEGLRCCIPAKYNDILEKQYGDYMKLPPIEQQISHHAFTAWYK